MDKEYIAKRKKELEKEFEVTKKELAEFIKQAEELNKKHSAAMDKVKSIQAAWGELDKAEKEKSEVNNVAKEEKQKSDKK